jgi:hypothetical protein
MATDPPVYRAPMEPAAAEFAWNRGVCGMGGILRPAPADLPAALAGMADAHGERAAARLHRFARVPDGAYVWTRSADGYLLGRLLGPWRYDDSDRAGAVDLVHQRPCRWLADPVPEAEVPGGTLQTFGRGGRNFQQTHDVGISAQTSDVWTTHA